MKIKETWISFLMILLMLMMLSTTKAQEEYEPAEQMIAAIKAVDYRRVQEIIDDNYRIDSICSMCGISLGDGSKLDSGTALMQASALGQVNTIKKVLAAGADPDIIEEERDSEEWTPYSALMLSVISNNIDAVKLLIDHGADIDLENTFGENAIIIAVGPKGGNKEIVQYLLEQDADIDSYNRSGENLVAIARKNGHHTIIELLLLAGSRE